MAEKILCTIEQAITEVRRKRNLKRTSYRVWVRPFLPIVGTTKGFPGLASVAVTRGEFIRTIEDLLKNFEARGAYIELTIPTQDYESFYIG